MSCAVNIFWLISELEMVLLKHTRGLVRLESMQK